MFSAFPETAHVGTGSQRNILAIQPSQLGNPQTGLDRDQEEGPIATSYPGGTIWEPRAVHPSLPG